MKKHLQPSLASIQLRQRRTSMHSFFLLLSLIFFLLSSSALAEIRYVSKTGSSTPPYTSWATASDSIQKCINISQFGDTIYVENGVYREQVVMIPGLSLIGAGMDSCVIDTRDITQPLDFRAVTIKDSTLLKGFQIIVSNSDLSSAIRSDSGYAIVEHNRIRKATYGVGIRNANVLIQDNLIENIDRGISLFNSNSIVRNNHLNNVEEGVGCDAFTGDYSPKIYSNLILCERFGVNVRFNSSPSIYNNIIYLMDNAATGYSGGGSDSVWIYNNIVLVEDEYSYNLTDGFANTRVPTIEYNNFVIGNIRSAYRVWIHNKIKNNVAINGETGIIQFETGSDIEIKHNNSWNNDINYSGFTPDSTNISADPMFVDEDSLDFHLQMFSPLIDAGDPNILDKDGSRSDIGVFGGPYGEKYTYRDLAPKPPSNLTAQYDSGLVKLTWNRNTEADFFHYRVYRDTVPDFMYDTTKIIAVIPDTVFYDNLPEIYLPGNYYYKVTALDSTGHQSAPGEEVHINITGVPEGPPVVVEHYQLLNNYPNPFNPSTIIPYRLKEGGHVKLVVYTTLGEEVALLVDHYQPKGYYEAEFNPTKYQRRKGSFGNGLSFPTGYNDDIATGIYIYRLIVSDSYWETKFVASGKMILLK